MAEKTKMVAYKAADLNTLNDLELSCERDESFLGKVINIQLGAIEKANGDKATAITYEKVPLSSPLNIGHLIFEQFDDDADANVKSTALKLAGHTPVLAGEEPRAKVFIKNNTLNILVFREKS